MKNKEHLNDNSIAPYRREISAVIAGIFFILCGIEINRENIEVSFMVSIGVSFIYRLFIFGWVYFVLEEQNRNKYLAFSVFVPATSFVPGIILIIVGLLDRKQNRK